MAAILRWLDDAVLRMTWLSDAAWSAVRLIPGLDAQGPLAASLQFFLYDVVKLGLLLCTLVFVFAIIESHFPPERTRRMLGGRSGVGANLLGALLGTVTPFCACSSIPLFIGFTRAGLPLSVTFSFLISSPLVDFAAFILLASVFDLRIAIAYVAVGLALAVVGGTLIGSLNLEEDVAGFVRAGAPSSAAEYEPEAFGSLDRVRYAAGQVREVIGRVWKWVLVGVAIGALIHNWIPAEFVQGVLGGENPLSPVLATLLGAPVYADVFGTLPIAEALFAKGVGIGTVMSFMMAVTVLSVPSLVMLSKVVGRKLLGAFVGIVLVGVIAIGYVFDAVAPWLVG